jgi:hypothetical protein
MFALNLPFALKTLSVSIYIFTIIAPIRGKGSIFNHSHLLSTLVYTLGHRPSRVNVGLHVWIMKIKSSKPK